jgi:flavodoxin I
MNNIIEVEHLRKTYGDVVAVDDVSFNVMEGEIFGLLLLDLLVVGAPTHGAKPSPPMREFLKNLSEITVAGVSVAAFDTRMTTKWLKVFGYAAGKIGKALNNKGGNLLLKAEPFWVTGGKGPLKEGELERAAEWASEIIKAIR